MTKKLNLVFGTKTALIALTLLCAPLAQAEDQDFTTDVPAGGWPQTSLGPHTSTTLCNGSSTFVAELQDPSLFTQNVGNNPNARNVTGGTPLDGQGELTIGMSSVPNSQGTNFVQTYNTPVENLTFSIFDVDSVQNAWRDQIVITATNGGSPVAVNLSCGATNDSGGTCGFTISGGNTALAPPNQPTGFRSNTGRLDVSIPGPLDAINIAYTNQEPVGTSTQFIGLTQPNYLCGILGVAKTMTTSAAGESPYSVNIDFTIENFGELPINDVSATDDLVAVFGATPANWSFNSIMLLSGPAGFNVNSSYDGSSDTELITTGSTLPAPGGAQPAVATIRVVVDVVVYGSFTNQIDVSGNTPAGRNILDTSTSGADADGTDNDGNPNENTPTSFNTSSLPVTLSYFKANASNGQLEVNWETDLEFDNVGFELYAETEPGVRTPIAPIHATRNGQADYPQSYRITIADQGYSRLWLADISNRGNKRWHGPFEIDQPSGKPIAQSASLVWNQLADTVPNTPSRVTNASALEVRVNQDGLHRIRHQDLINAGLNLSLGSPDDLSLTLNGKPVPIWVGGNGDQFGADTYIDFIAEATKDSLYTRDNVYRLDFNPQLTRRISENNSLVGAVNETATHQASAVFAPNTVYDFSSPTDEPWRADELLSFGTPVSRSYQLALDGWVPGEERLKATVFGGTDFLVQPTTPPSPDACGNPSVNNAGGIPDHCVRFSVNGQVVREAAFDGLVPARIEQSVTGLLRNGLNTIDLEVPSEHGYRFDLVRLESLQFDYARELRAPSNNWTFTLSEDVVTRGDRLFSDAFDQPAQDEAGNLLDENRVEGISVANLASGEFVAYGNTSGNPVRLNGAVRSGGRVLIPNVSSNRQYWLAQTSQISVPALSGIDDQFPAVSSQTEYLMIAHPAFLATAQTLADFHRARGLNVSLVDVEQVYAQYSNNLVSPDAIVEFIRSVGNSGRLQYILLVGGDTYDYFNYLGLDSVSHIPSIYGATDDIIRYAPLDPLYGDLNGDEIPEIPVGRLPVRNNIELSELITKITSYQPAANNDASVHFIADAAEPQYDYGQISDDLAQLLPQSWTTSATRRDDFDSGDNARDDLVNAINGSPNLVTYLGHSGPRTWFRRPVFNADDTSLLSNPVPNVTVQWGCWNSYYVSPQADTLGHRLLLSGSQGAATVLGAASLTGVASETAFAEYLMPALSQPGTTLGEAVIQAKRVLASDPADFRDIVLGWTILGDPAIQIVE